MSFQEKRLSLLTMSALIVGLACLHLNAHAQVRATPQRANAQPARIANPSATAGAVDMFLKIEGVDGESKDEGHQDWIEIQSWSWGGARASANANRRAPAGNGPGTLVLVKPVDRSSPKLSEACTGGKSLGRLVVHARSSRGTGYEEYVVEDATVSSCTRSSSGDRPTETLTLNFGKVESGDPDRPVITGR